MSQPPYSQQPTPPHQQPPARPPYPPQQYGPPGPYAPAHAMPEPKNGLGLAGLICVLVALPCALVPIGFIFGGPLAIVGLSLGIAGQARVSRGRATNKGVCAAAILLGVLALLGAINGARITFTAVNELGNQMEQIGVDADRMADCINKATTPEETMACAD